MRLSGLVVYGATLAVLTGACAARSPAAHAPAAQGVSAIRVRVRIPDDPSATAANDDEDEESAASDAEVAPGDSEPDPARPCPSDMALVDASASSASPAPRRFCVDKYEASLAEVLADGTERPYPHYLPVDGHVVRAVSQAHVFPQGYISEVQAQDACGASGKHLCQYEEWKTACMGPSHTTFPYGDVRRAGACHDAGKSAVVAVFGAKAVAASVPYPTAPAVSATPAAPAAPPRKAEKRAHVTKGRAAKVTHPRASSAKSTPKAGGGRPAARRGVRAFAKKSARPMSVNPGVWAKLNDPALGQVEGALARTGEHEECSNGFGVFDTVGNVHEWVATDPAASHGTFAGGYYLDTTINGDGCLYKTQAHAHDYHDYSTGFRCCAPAMTDGSPSDSR